jgi:hypothetical protein
MSGDEDELASAALAEQFMDGMIRRGGVPTAQHGRYYDTYLN